LLDAKPRLFSEAIIENFLRMNSKVSVRGLELLACCILPLVSLGHNDDVLTLSEWVLVVGDRFHDDLRVVGKSLIA